MNKYARQICSSVTWFCFRQFSPSSFFLGNTYLFQRPLQKGCDMETLGNLYLLQCPPPTSTPGRVGLSPAITHWVKLFLYSKTYKASLHCCHVLDPQLCYNLAKTCSSMETNESQHKKLVIVLHCKSPFLITLLQVQIILWIFEDSNFNPVLLVLQPSFLTSS